VLVLGNLSFSRSTSTAAIRIDRDVARYLIDRIAAPGGIKAGAPERARPLPIFARH